MATNSSQATPTAAKATASSSNKLEDWVRDYAPLPGIHDEFIDVDGKSRPHWLRFLNALARSGGEEISRRFVAADRRIRDMGISHRVYGETNERPWPLSRMPLLISSADWQEISTGIAQRVELLERVLADVYGPGALVSGGDLPAAAVAGSPEYLHAMRGVTPPGGKWLRFYAADIGRGPDGRWWVLDDRAQAPSGSGYALENRLVLSRALPNLYRSMNVERLAPFFREYRAGLRGAADRTDPRICLLTPGPYSETYFEQAYLARYLGFLLVEGEDLVVSEGKAYVRTIAGLRRADVLWRRVDTDWCDPLEANAASRIGLPGMFEAIRGGNHAVANMPGSGFVEARALLGFLPNLCKRILGEDLKLPNIATWWCGQPSERERVLGNLDQLAISGAFTEGLPGASGPGRLVGAELDSTQRAAIVSAIESRGVDYVGQEVVRLSTTPVWQDDKLVPRPFVLRVYAAATPDGWHIMPGGFCRVSDRPDARAIYMGDGARSSDVWVLADKPVEMTTLLPTNDSIKIVRLLGNLPSRAADNLFWLARYLERAEATLRLVRCLCNRLIDSDPSIPEAGQTLDRLKRLLIAWGAVPSDTPDATPTNLAVAALQSLEQYGSALSIAQAARRAASTLRERLSQDVWRLIGRLEDRIGETLSAQPSESEALDCADNALGTIAALSGLIQENVNRVAGWNFLDIGRRVERGINTCRFTRQFADAGATAESLDVLLDLIDSQITYRSRYLTGVTLATVRDMALLDPYNPRSLGFQVTRIDEHLSSLPALQPDGVLDLPRRLSTRLAAEIATEEAERIDMKKILSFEQRLAELAEAITTRYFLQTSSHAHQEQSSSDLL